MRRKLAVLLALCVATSAAWVPAGAGTVRAEETQTAESQTNVEVDFEYEELANDTIKIIKYKGNGTEAVVPAEINGKRVVIIGDQTFSKCSNLISISIPSGVTNIGEGTSSYQKPETDVFSECRNLKEVIVDGENVSYSSKDGLLYNKEKTELFLCPAAKTGGAIIEEGVTSLDAVVFRNCSDLTDITIPSSVTSIVLKKTDSDFYMAGCSSLKGITVADDNTLYSSQDGILYNEEKTKLMFCPPGKEGNVTVPDGIVNINDAAFQNCIRLSDIVISDGVIRIGWLAFQNCSSLSSIAIPKSVSEIKFSSENWSQGDGDIPFKNCSGLTDISVNAENPVYASDDGMLFTKDMNQLLCCPAGKQGEATVPDGVTKIGLCAFDDCNGLKKITVAKSVTNINGWGDEHYQGITFETCRNLEEISVDMGSKTYSSWNGILYSKDMTELLCCPPGKKGDISVPSGVMEIRDYAFCNCTNLTSVLIPQSVEGIGRYEDMGEEYSVFIGCSNLTDIIVDDLNEKYRSSDGILYIGNALLCCPAGKKGDVTISDEINEIGYYAFQNCSNLTSVTLPESSEISEIGSYAFQNCSNLTSVTLPKNMRSSRIRYHVFWGCIRLENVIMPKELSSQLFDNGTFEGCGDGICLICVEGSEAESYAIKYGINYKTVEREKGLQSIYASDVTKTVGDMPFLIRVELDGDGELSFESSNESVASVTSEGIAVIRGVGEAQIAIRAAETEEYKAAEKTITITVNSKSGGNENPGAEKRPQTITVDNYIKTEGDAPFTIKAATDGDGTLSYESSDESVAVVSAKGTVALVGDGTVDITIRAAETENYEAAEKSITITVNPKSGGDENPGAEKRPQTITADNYIKTEGDAPFAIGATTDGDGALSYESENESVAVVSAKGTVALMGTGTANITIQASETKNYKAAEKTITITVNPKSGGNENPGTEKKLQTITADNYIKTEGDTPFVVGAATDGDGALSYESGNESVAVVSAKGTVALAGTGTATITIRAAETENYEAAEKTVTVTVSPKPGNTQKPETGDKPQNPPAKRTQSVTAASFRKAYGDSPFPLWAKASGGGTLSYVVKNPAVASVDSNGVVTLKGYGVTEITVRAAANSAYAAAEKTVTLTVVPKKLSVTSVKSTKTGTLTVKWKKDRKASGYIIEYSTDRKFRKKVKTATVRKNKATSRKLTKLKAGKKYYVRVCAYAEAGGEKIKGAYGLAKKAIKVK